MDNNLDAVPAEQPVVDPTTEAPTVEQPIDILPDELPEPPASDPDVPPVQDTPEPAGTPRYEKRIRQLSATVRELRTQQTGPQAPQPPVPQAPVQPNHLPAGDYSPEDIQAFIQREAVRTGQAFSSIEVQQLREEMNRDRETTELVQSYHNDLRDVETKYPELNEDSPDFQPHLAQTVTELYEDAFQANPKSASLSKIAKSIMTIHRQSALKSATQAATSVAQQMQNGAPAPTGESPKGGAPTEDPFLKGLLG